jgi:predicted aspartyl protease
MRTTFVLAALCLLAAAPAYAEDSCRLVRMASVDMGQEREGLPIVPMAIGAETANLVVDTGGFLTLLSQAKATSLGLQAWGIAPDMVGRMVGGIKVDHFLIAPSVDLGGLKAKNFRFTILPTRFSLDSDGTIAPDILTQYDADFDFANAKFNLFSRNHCPGKVVYWTTEPYAGIDITVETFGHIMLSVVLDGHKERALIDTGSSRSAISLETAKSDFHLSDADLRPLGSDSTGAKVHPFKTLTLQNVTVTDPDIVLLPDSYAHLGSFGAPTILLGMGVLRQLHLYIAYGEHKIYVTPASAH